MGHLASVWLFSAAISLVVAPLSVVLLFYGYTGALGFHALFIDILLVPIILRTRLAPVFDVFKAKQVAGCDICCCDRGAPDRVYRIYVESAASANLF